MRNLSIFGKACIINVLALAKVWYAGSVLKPPKKVSETLEKEITGFLWRHKNHLVNREILRLEKGKGGLGIPSIEDKCQVLKLKWLKYIIDERDKRNRDWIELANAFFMNFSPKINDVYKCFTVKVL